MSDYPPAVQRAIRAARQLGKYPPLTRQTMIIDRQVQPTSLPDVLQVRYSMAVAPYEGKPACLFDLTHVLDPFEVPSDAMLDVLDGMAKISFARKLTHDYSKPVFPADLTVLPVDHGPKHN